MKVESDDRARFERETKEYAAYQKQIEKSNRKKKRGSIVKDPNRPKRPLTAFFVFTNEERKKVQDSRPGITLTETSKVLGLTWRNLGKSS